MEHRGLSPPTVNTGITDTSAARLTVRAAALGYDQDLTVVWSTKRVWCVRGDTDHVSVRRTDVPIVWDPNGRGHWEADASEQCGRCGKRVGPVARTYDGHLSGPELAAAAKRVAAA